MRAFSVSSPFDADNFILFHSFIRNYTRHINGPPVVRAHVLVTNFVGMSYTCCWKFCVVIDSRKKKTFFFRPFLPVARQRETATKTTSTAASSQNVGTQRNHYVYLCCVLRCPHYVSRCLTTSLCVYAHNTHTHTHKPTNIEAIFHPSTDAGSTATPNETERFRSTFKNRSNENERDESKRYDFSFCFSSRFSRRRDRTSVWRTKQEKMTTSTNEWMGMRMQASLIFHAKEKRENVCAQLTVAVVSSASFGRWCFLSFC